MATELPLMNNKIELANPINLSHIKTGILISSAVVIVCEVYEYFVHGLSWINPIIVIFMWLLGFFVWNSRQITNKPKSIEIEGDRLILHFRFKTKPVIMRLEDIKSLTVSLDGSNLTGFIGFDASLIFKEKEPVEWFYLFWKSAIIVREQYKLRFGEYPPMMSIIRKNTTNKLPEKL